MSTSQEIARKSLFEGYVPRDDARTEAHRLAKDGHNRANAFHGGSPLREGHQLLGEIARAARGLLCLGEQRPRARSDVFLPPREGQVSENDREHVVEVVRNAPSEDAERLELRYTEEVLLDTFPRRHVLHHDDRALVSLIVGDRRPRHLPPRALAVATREAPLVGRGGAISLVHEGEEARAEERRLVPGEEAAESGVDARQGPVHLRQRHGNRRRVEERTKALLADAESVVLRRRRSELRDGPLEEHGAPRRIEGRLQADLGVERLSRIDADATPLEAGDSRPAKLLGCHEASRDLVPLLRVFVHVERAVPDRVLRFREAVQPRARRVDPNDPLGDVVDLKGADVELVEELPDPSLVVVLRAHRASRLSVRPGNQQCDPKEADTAGGWSSPARYWIGSPENVSPSAHSAMNASRVWKIRFSLNVPRERCRSRYS